MPGLSSIGMAIADEESSPLLSTTMTACFKFLVFLRANVKGLFGNALRQTGWESVASTPYHYAIVSRRVSPRLLARSRPRAPCAPLVNEGVFVQVVIVVAGEKGLIVTHG